MNIQRIVGFILLVYYIQFSFIFQAVTPTDIINPLILPQSTLDLIIKLLTLNKTIISNINTSENEGYFISLSFENENSFQQINLNMLNNYTLITPVKHKTNKDCSTLIQHEQYIDYKSKSTEDVFPCNGLIFLDKTNNENKLKNFNYFLSSDYPYKGSLGLTHMFQNKQYSIIHKLKSSFLIGKESFGFYKEDFQKKFFMGTPPFNYNKTNGNFKEGLCNVNTTNVKWTCVYNKITYNSKTFQPVQSSSVVFNSGQHAIYVSKEIWNFITGDVYKYFLDEHLCVIINSKGDATIKCRKEIETQVHKFILHMNNYTYTIEQDKLFITYSSTIELIIRYRKESKDTLSLGTVFFDLFDIVTFDYNASTVSFVTQEQNLINNSTELKSIETNNIFSIRKTILIINIFMLLCYNVIYFIFKLINKIN